MKGTLTRTTIALGAFGLIFSLFQPGPDAVVDYEFSCATQLTNRDIKLYIPNKFDGYSDDDIDFLSDLTSFIIDINEDTVICETFLNQRYKDVLVVDIFGLSDFDQIDKTTCAIFKNEEFRLPKNTTFLFHQYTNTHEDGGVFVVLTNN